MCTSVRTCASRRWTTRRRATSSTSWSSGWPGGMAGTTVFSAGTDLKRMVPAAYVEPENGARPSEEELIAFVREKIASFKVPRHSRFVDEWPMSGTKIRKAELRERIRQELETAGITEAPALSELTRAAVP